MKCVAQTSDVLLGFIIGFMVEAEVEAKMMSKDTISLWLLCSTIFIALTCTELTMQYLIPLIALMSQKFRLMSML